MVSLSGSMMDDICVLLDCSSFSLRVSSSFWVVLVNSVWRYLICSVSFSSACLRASSLALRSKSSSACLVASAISFSLHFSCRRTMIYTPTAAVATRRNAKIPIIISIYCNFCAKVTFFFDNSKYLHKKRTMFPPSFP